MISQSAATQTEVQISHIDRLVPYARNPRKNDSAVDRMCSSIRAFGQATARLQQASSAAVSVMTKTMVDAGAGASTRLRAADLVYSTR